MVLLVCLLLAANLIWGQGQWGWPGRELHPYLFAVAAVAVRHGLGPGLIFSGVAALLMVGLSRVGPEPLQLLELLDSPHRVILASWIVAASILGAATEASQKKLRYLQKTLNRQKEQDRVLVERSRQLEQENMRLRGQLLGQPHSVATVYEMAKGLTTLRDSDLFEAALSMIAEHVGAEVCSVLVKTPSGELKLMASLGRGPAAQDIYLDPKEGLAGLALRERRTVTFRELLRTGEAAVEAVIATPLRLDDEELMGVVLVERLPLEYLTAQKVDTLEILADWTARSFQLAYRYSLAQAEGELELLRRRFAERRLGRGTLLALAREPEQAPQILELAGDSTVCELGQLNAIHLLTLLGQKGADVSQGLASLAEGLVAQGVRLRSLLKKLPLRDDLVGCLGLRFRIEDREAQNRDALALVMSFFEGPSLEDSQKLVQLAGRLGLDSERQLRIALGLEAPPRDRRPREEVVEELCAHPDFWTRTCAVRCAYELGHQGSRARLERGLESSDLFMVESCLEVLLLETPDFQIPDSTLVQQAYAKLVRNDRHESLGASGER